MDNHPASLPCLRLVIDQQHAQVIIDFLVQLQVLQAAPSVRVHVHADWHQTDGSSCGLFTAATIISLAQGRLLWLPLQDDIMAWRNYFGAEVVRRFV